MIRSPIRCVSSDVLSEVVLLHPGDVIGRWFVLDPPVPIGRRDVANGSHDVSLGSEPRGQQAVGTD